MSNSSNADNTEEVIRRKTRIITRQAENPWPDPKHSDAAAAIIGTVALAYVSYLRNDVGNGDSLIDDLRAAQFPKFDVINGTPHPYDWPGEFILPVFMRMYVNDRTRNCMGDTQQQAMREMILEYLEGASDLNKANGGPWVTMGTENHTLMRSTSCLLGAYALSTSNDFANETIGGKNPVDHYHAWRDQLMQWLKERAMNGLHDEIHSPQYGKYTVASICNLLDFPGTGPDDDKLRQRATHYLQLYWHDVAHDFNKTTAVQAACGSRVYQPSPSGEGGAYYKQPGRHWNRAWLWMYTWHDKDPGGPGPDKHPVMLTAADNDFAPLGLSRDLALMDKKRFEYASRRPTRDHLSANVKSTLR